MSKISVVYPERRTLDGHENIICTQFQLSTPYLFHKIAVGGRTDWHTQNGDWIVALRQLKMQIFARQLKYFAKNVDTTEILIFAMSVTFYRFQAFIAKNPSVSNQFDQWGKLNENTLLLGGILKNPKKNILIKKWSLFSLLACRPSGFVMSQDKQLEFWSRSVAPKMKTTWENDHNIYVTGTSSLVHWSFWWLMPVDQKVTSPHIKYQNSGRICILSGRVCCR